MRKPTRTAPRSMERQKVDSSRWCGSCSSSERMCTFETGGIGAHSTWLRRADIRRLQTCWQSVLKKQTRARLARLHDLHDYYNVQYLIEGMQNTCNTPRRMQYPWCEGAPED